METYCIFVYCSLLPSFLQRSVIYFEYVPVWKNIEKVQHIEKALDSRSWCSTLIIKCRIVTWRVVLEGGFWRDVHIVAAYYILPPLRVYRTLKPKGLLSRASDPDISVPLASRYNLLPFLHSTLHACFQMFLLTLCTNAHHESCLQKNTGILQIIVPIKHSKLDSNFDP